MDCGKINIGSSSSSQKSARSMRILLVDADVTSLSIVSATLKKFNYEVVTTRHPQDAIYTLRLKKGAFDLVLSDVQLPDIDGFELQKAIAQEFHLPVVLMSADCEFDIVTKGLDDGAAFFIPKPASADDLRDLWRFARIHEKRPITGEEIQSLPAPETSSDKINLKETITISDSSAEEDIDHVEKDSKKKRQPSENTEVSSSSSPKRPKLVWTNTLNNLFLEAIRTIGLEDAVPRRILDVMDVPGLTRENVASHLQKYRIFLRRVADASLEIPSRRNESSTGRFTSRFKSSETGSSSSILDKFSENNNQKNTWRFPDLNLPASTGLTYARILANRGILGKTNAASSSLVIQDADRSCAGAGESSSNHTRPSAENKCDQSVGTSSNSVPAELPKSSPLGSNYVGYRLSDLQRLAESGSLLPNSRVMNLPNAEIQGNNIPSSAANLRDEGSSFKDFLDEFFADSPPASSAPDYINEQQLSAVIADYQKLITDPNPSLQKGLEIDGDDVLEDDSSSLFDLDEFDFMSTDLSSDGVGIDHTTHPDTEATPQLDEQQATTNTGPSDSQEFNASSHLNTTHLPPKSQLDEEEFLDPLFVNFPGK